MLMLASHVILPQIGEKRGIEGREKKERKKEKKSENTMNYIEIPKMPRQPRRGGGMTERHAEISHVSSG